MDTTSPAPRLRTPDQAEIPSLLEELAASGQSLAAFARERGLTTWKLYPARQAAPPTKRRSKAEFDPVRVLPVPQPLELDLGSRGVIRIPLGFDEGELRRLLEVLAC